MLALARIDVDAPTVVPEPTDPKVAAWTVGLATIIEQSYPPWHGRKTQTLSC